MPDFTHLHLHSHYSLLDGLGKIPDILDRVKELDMDSVALTDHGVMYGTVEFAQEAQKRGIKPILGVEAYLAPNGHTNKRGKVDANPRHLTLLSRTTEGYKNLIKLTTEAHLHGYYYKPRIDYDLLEKYGDGVIVLSGCMNSDISRAILEKRLPDAEKLIEWHLNRFGRENFFLEVQDHPHIEEQKILNAALFEYAKMYKLDVTATADAHYVSPEDANAQDVLICVQTGKTVQDKDRLSMLGEDFSISTPKDVAAAWKDHPEVLENTQKIADMCQAELTFGVNHLPRYPLPKGKTTDQELRTMCENNIPARYPAAAQGSGGRSEGFTREDIQKRLDYELEVIKATGYASYFLIVADFVNEAKRRGILVGPGRGSAAGSIVSYLTNITNIDPLTYNLLFERFLNPQRVSMPDIDLDFADDRRDEVIEYVREKYGREYVAQIITFGTMAARAAVRDAGRALGYPYAFCDTVAKLIPPFTDFAEALKQGTELRAMYDADPQAKRLLDMAKKLEGVVRHASTHAAGVVIGDAPLTEYVPLQYTTTGENEETTVTQYAMGAVEALGLLKMDFLGLKNLTIIKHALEIIRDRHGKEIVLDELPLDDEKAYRLLQLGQTTGVFQLESSGMKRYLKELKPTEFEDIISMVALYRPGPMDSIPDFIAAKHGKKQITYLHPILKPILEKTYGVIVTQDQVLQIAREFAGFTYAEADILRKAVGKKIKELLDEQREKFITGAITAKKIEKKTAQKVWDFIEPFARYGFNRAHAACYAMIAYQTAYLKAHYPAEFMAALLTSDEGNTDRQAIEVAEALTMNLKVLPPDVNESRENFMAVDDSTIRFGLAAIKNVGAAAMTTLIEERTKNGKFTDLSDLFRRIKNHDLNKKTVESLARAGALDQLSERNIVLSNIDALIEFGKTMHKKADTGQKNLFGGTVVALAPATVNLTPVEPATKQERLSWEKELLGLYVSEHPLSEFQATLATLTLALSDLPSERVGSTVRVAAVTAQVKKITTKNGQPMMFVQLEDLAGKAEAVVFPSILKKTASVWVEGASLLIQGKLNDKDGEKKILVDSAETLTLEALQGLSPLKRTSRPALPTPQGILISLSAAVAKDQLSQLRKFLEAKHQTDGNLPVRLRLPYSGTYKTVVTPYRLSAGSPSLEELAAMMGKEAVKYEQ